MERVNRAPFQGITNIIRFNWHLYAISLAIMSALLIANSFLPGLPGLAAKTFLFFIALSILISLGVSFYIYDISDFYSLSWLKSIDIGPHAHILNINAGFDETSQVLKNKFPQSTLTVVDFYDPVKHTEISIERARKAYPKYPGTSMINTSDTILPAGSVNCALLIFAAHEIRNDQERIAFFRQIRQTLAIDGQLVIVEHLRDKYNFFAYNIGAFHFFTRRTWEHTFKAAGFAAWQERKINRFVSIFCLKKDGITT